MLIGVLSDTHGQIYATLKAIRMLESCRVGTVIHCGDIGSPAIVSLFQQWPTHFVFGNVDDPRSLEAAIREAGQTSHQRFGSLEAEGKQIAFMHSDDQNLFRQTVRSGGWDVVCHGHTHLAEISTAGRTLVLNPGAIDRTEHPSVAVLELPSLAATPISL